MQDLQCLRRGIIFHGKVDSEGFWRTSLNKGKGCGIRYNMDLIKDHCYSAQSRLMDEFDKFAAKDGESLDSVHERLTTPVNIMDRNNVHPIPVAINIKFLNCLKPEWSKYVTMVRQNQSDKVISYDMLYDSLVQFKPHVLASRAKKAAKNHDPLALIAHSHASLSHLHANSSYSPQSYYVIHPPIYC
ncbi:hypothetical protein Tco_0286567 [Tanacetum coccineum]